MSEITESTLTLLKNKKNKLESEKSAAEKDGNLEAIAEVDSKIQEVNEIIKKIE